MIRQVGLHVWLSHPVYNLLVVFVSFQEFILICMYYSIEFKIDSIRVGNIAILMQKM